MDRLSGVQTVQLINTGSELLLGAVLNTHQQWLSRRLTDLGYRVSAQVSVPDTAPAIEAAVAEALRTADLVLITGGLGPTSDDRTREVVARLCGRQLREDPAVRAHVEAFYRRRGRSAPERVRVQAQVPEGATVFLNAQGSAPGLAMEVEAGRFGRAGGRAFVVMLPGPPRELRPMFDTQVAPWLRKALPLEQPFVCRTLRTTGLPESWLEARVAEPLQPWLARGLELGYCSRPGEVDLRLAAAGPEAEAVVGEAERLVRERLGEFIYTDRDEPLEAVLIRLLTERRRTLAVAESCTGGCLAHRLTNVPGASAVFLAGWVTYSNDAKQRCLGVGAETLARHGAVSEPTAREMAAGARAAAQADYALATTGIAGPTGGTPGKPVGTVFIALADTHSVFVVRRLNAFDRETFKQVTTQQALEMLRRRVLGLPDST